MAVHHQPELDALRSIVRTKVSGDAAPPAPIPGLSQLQQHLSTSVMVEHLLQFAMEDVADQQLLHNGLEPGVQQRDDTQLAVLLEALATRTQQVQEALEAFAGQALRELHAQQHRSAAGDIALLLGIGNVFVQRVGAMLIAQPSLQLAPWVERFYTSALSHYATQLHVPDGANDDAMDDEASAAPPPQTLAALQQGPWGTHLRTVSTALWTLGLHALGEAASGRALSRHLRARLAARTHQAFEEEVLPEALAYARALAAAYLPLTTPLQGARALAAWQQRLEFYVYHTVGTLRIYDLFGIVLEYPDSTPAVEDVKACLERTSLADTVVQVFGAELQRRLLHVGAITSDILHAYISTIKVLRVVDPTGTLLAAVGAPVKEYLRSRRDTIRCVVTLLTDAGGEEGMGDAGLLEDLQAGSLEAPPDAANEANIDCDRQLWQAIEGWTPVPVDGHAEVTRGRNADIIGSLVEIYGSQELFVNEYRSMLAERLLSKADVYNVEREVHTLELLKLRFGEASLHGAGIMLKDVTDSKRLNTAIQQLPNTATPTKVQDMLDTYAAKYHSAKLPRKLVWKKSLGTVTLDVTVGDDTRTMQATPLQAAILCAFTEQASWPLQALAAHVGVSAAEARRRALFWVGQGVLVESRGVDGEWCYGRATRLGGGGQGPLAAVEQDDEMGDAGGDTGDELVHAMAPFETYIMGMLTNFDSLPLDRIHNMLKMFAVQPPYDRSMEDLAGYLAKLAAEDKLAVEGGVYRKTG